MHDKPSLQEKERLKDYGDAIKNKRSQFLGMSSLDDERFQNKDGDKHKPS